MTLATGAAPLKVGAASRGIPDDTLPRYRNYSRRLAGSLPSPRRSTQPRSRTWSGREDVPGAICGDGAGRSSSGSGRLCACRSRRDGPPRHTPLR